VKPRSAQFAFDTDVALDAVVPISSHIPEEAMTAGLLGTERSGHGAVIGEDGLIVTIGYLIAEAESVWIGSAEDGNVVPGYVVGYDFDTGFGLIRPMLPLARPRLPLGRAADLQVGDVVMVAGGGTEPALEARVAAKQEFAGRWEYLLEEAIYTVPAHSDWAGAALLDRQGRLCGIGSLLVHDGSEGENGPAANLFVPIDILTPIIDEICAHGRQRRPPRPWLGVLVHEDGDELLIAGVYRNCPGDIAGLKPGDVIFELDGRPVGSLADFYRQMWSLGSAGVRVPLAVLRDGELRRLVVHSADRAAFFHKGTIN
jgi:S1-C subfamily serine protease